MTRSWHPNLRELVRLADPSTVFAINIRTSVPIEPWTSTNVTLLGDAIHTMTPGRGVGANTALRDARNRSAARSRPLAATKRSLIDAVRAYESQMIRYGFEAVIESRKQMSGDDPIHKPVIGRAALIATRTVMGVVNAVPPLKRRMAEAQARFRGFEERSVSMTASGSGSSKSRP